MSTQQNHPTAAGHPAPTPKAATSPIEHVVIIVKENHTFDNYFGRYPGVNGQQLPQAPDLAEDAGHTHAAWLKREDPAGTTQRLQYDKADIPAYWAYAQQYTLCDNYFSDIASQSEPNHLVLITAHSPLIDNANSHRTYQPQPPYDLPSLPAALQAAHRDWRDYAGEKLASYFRNIKALASNAWNVSADQFDTDVARGFLPAVSWLYAASGLSEHPGTRPTDMGVKAGAQWTSDRVQAVARSALWPKTAIFVTWDDWGGWTDHVAPPEAAKWPGKGPAGYHNSPFRYGSRVPCLVISPYAKIGINSTFHSHVSLVKFCLRNFGLPSLGGFDAVPNDKSDDMWTCFDFKAPPRSAVPSAIPK